MKITPVRIVRETFHIYRVEYQRLTEGVPDHETRTAIAVVSGKGWVGFDLRHLTVYASAPFSWSEFGPIAKDVRKVHELIEPLPLRWTRYRLEPFAALPSWADPG